MHHLQYRNKMKDRNKMCLFVCEKFDSVGYMVPKNNDIRERADLEK